MEEIPLEAEEDVPFWNEAPESECFGIGEAWTLLGLTSEMKIKEEPDDLQTEPPSPILDALKTTDNNTQDPEDPLWTAVQKEVIVKAEKLTEKVLSSNKKFLISILQTSFVSVFFPFFFFDSQIKDNSG